jgi:hypothetical protein
MSTSELNPSGRITTFKIICGINILLSIIYIIHGISLYNDYKSMPGALYGNSFLIMDAFEIIIITGLVLMFFAKKKGFYFYLAGQLISFVYTIASGREDTVWGLLILPAFIVPILFTVYYSFHLKELK